MDSTDSTSSGSELESLMKLKSKQGPVCLICQKGGVVLEISYKSADTFIKSTELREAITKTSDSDIRTAISNMKLGNFDNLFWHKNCYLSYTSKKNIQVFRKKHTRLEECLDTESIPLPSFSRSLRKNIFDINRCVICQKRGPSKRLSQVMSINIERKIKNIATINSAVLERIGCDDLIALEVKYHVSCLNSELRKFKQSTANVLKFSSDGREDKPFENIIGKLHKGIAKGKTFALTSVYNEYVEANGMKSKRVFTDILKKRSGNKLEIVKSKRANESSIISPRFEKSEVLHEYMETAEDASCSQTLFVGSSEISQVYKICADIREELDKIPDFTQYKDLDVTNYKKHIPKSLIWLINLIIEASDDSIFALSICQDIIYTRFKGKKLTPKHVGLGIMVHQETRSKRIVESLHSCGHSISYKDVLRIRNTIAQEEVIRYTQNDNCYLPRQLVPNKFVQFAADNIDILEETLDKSPTFHGTQVVAFQQGPPNYDLSSTLKLLPYKVKLDIPEDFHLLHQINFNKGNRVPPQVHDKSNLLNEVKAPSFIHSYNLAWVLCRTDETSKETVVVPQWSGFGKLLHEDNVPITTYAYLPLLPYVASDYDTVWTTMLKCNEIARKLEVSHTVITFDQAIYFKAKEIQWLRPDECSHYVIRLGGFHVMLNFLKVIGQHMEHSGLNDVWLESNLYGESTVAGIMNGKKWNKGIRAHKLTYESLMRIVLPIFEKWLVECKSDLIHVLNVSRLTASEVNRKVKKREPPSDFFNIVKSCQSLSDAFTEFVDGQSPTFKLWYSYIVMVELLLEFLYSERAGKWELHLESFRKMLPMFFAYDHTNYARWGSVYICDMLNLSVQAPEVYEQFLKGNFVVKKSAGGFNRISVDQALEHVNKTSKDAGGIVGLTKNSTRLDEWYLSYNEIGNMINSFLSSLRFQVCSGSSQNIEIGKQRILVDEQSVVDLQNQFLKYGVFTVHFDNVTSISTKEIYSQELEVSRLCVAQRGEAAMKSFVENIDTMDFYKPLKKLNKSANVKQKKNPPAKSDSMLGQQFLQKILAAKEMGRNVEYNEIFQYELTPFPMSLTVNGQLNTPSHKSALGAIVQEYTQCVNKLPPVMDNAKTCHIFDGMSVVQRLGKPSKCRTFGDYANIFANMIFNNPHGAERIDVVFDHYKEQSIKRVTRQKRGPKSSIQRIIENTETPLPQQWHLFIHSVINKNHLTNFLSEHLSVHCRQKNFEFVTSGGFSNITDFKTNFDIGDTTLLIADHEEADSRIILHALSAKMAGYFRCIIECSDTDVLVLLVHFKEFLTQELWMKVGNADSRRYIPVHDIHLEVNLCRNLPAFHALTGCDTTSQFAGLGKKTCWKVYQEYSHYLNGVGVDDFTETLFDQMHNFVLKLYSKNSDIVSVNILRGVMAASTPVTKLPPTKDALKLHCLRVYYQTKVWMQAMVPCPDLPPIEEFGWHLDEQGNLSPVLTTLPAFPQDLKVLISCGCKKGTQHFF